MKNNSYSAVAKALHWAMALGIFGLVVLGSVMSDMEFSPEKLQYFSWHKWAGVTLFFLVWIRLVWRLISPPPPYSVDMPLKLQRLAHTGHFALYAFMVIVPITGWLMSSAKGVPTVWFGVVQLPDLISKDKALGHLLEEVHGTLSWILVTLIAGHVLAALKHHFIDRDDTLRRMAPFIKLEQDAS
jgi:cytochrome b561